jgi:hypothetical protein
MTSFKVIAATFCLEMLRRADTLMITCAAAMAASSAEDVSEWESDGGSDSEKDGADMQACIHNPQAGSDSETSNSSSDSSTNSIDEHDAALMPGDGSPDQQPANDAIDGEEIVLSSAGRDRRSVRWDAHVRSAGGHSGAAAHASSSSSPDHQPVGKSRKSRKALAAASALQDGSKQKGSKKARALEKLGLPKFSKGFPVQVQEAPTEPGTAMLLCGCHTAFVL